MTLYFSFYHQQSRANVTVQRELRNKRCSINLKNVQQNANAECTVEDKTDASLFYLFHIFSPTITMRAS